MIFFVKFSHKFNSSSSQKDNHFQDYGVFLNRSIDLSLLTLARIDAAETTANLLSA